MLYRGDVLDDVLNTARVVGDGAHGHGILLRGQSVDGALPACSDARDDCLHVALKPLCPAVYEGYADFVVRPHGEVDEGFVDKAAGSMASRPEVMKSNPRRSSSVRWSGPAHGVRPETEETVS